MATKKKSSRKPAANDEPKAEARVGTKKPARVSGGHRVPDRSQR